MFKTQTVDYLGIEYNWEIAAAKNQQLKQYFSSAICILQVSTQYMLLSNTPLFSHKEDSYQSCVQIFISFILLILLC